MTAVTTCIGRCSAVGSAGHDRSSVLTASQTCKSVGFCATRDQSLDLWLEEQRRWRQGTDRLAGDTDGLVQMFSKQPYLAKLGNGF